MNTMHSHSVPEPRFSASYGHGWEQIKKHFLVLLLLVIFLGLADSPASLARESDRDETLLTPILYLLSLAYGFLILPVFNYGGDLLFVKAIRDQKLEIETVIQGFRNNYVHIILAHLITTALIILGFLFLIIPGIILACRLAFVSYLVMDKGLEPVAAIEKSWEMTRGHGLRIFGMGLAAVPLFCAGLLFFIVGAVVAVMWVKAAFASLYYAIDARQQRENDPYIVRE